MVKQTCRPSPSGGGWEGAPKAVLFDMDGVCYDSMPNHVIAWQRAMATFGIRMTEDDAYMTEGQRGTDTIIQLVRAQQGRDIGEEEAQRMYDEKAREFGLLPTARIMPGVLELMTLIKAQGLGIGIVTGSGQRPLIGRLLSDFAEFIDRKHLVTAYDVKHGKPHPEPYRKGARKFGLQPQEVVVVENAPLGVRAGVAAGCYTIAVNTGPLPPSALRKAGAHCVMTDMHTLCRKWPTLFSHRATQDEHWNDSYEAYKAYLLANKHRPSKHHAEDRSLANWLRYNRRLMSRGLLRQERVERLQELLNLSAKYRRVNQYAYLSTGQELHFLDE